MHTEDSHDDAGMDLMFGRRADPRITQDERYQISHPKVPRRERASVQMLGILFLVLMLCIGVPAIVHLVSVVRQFFHSIG